MKLIDKIYDKGLIRQLLDYGNKSKPNRAYLIYRECLRMKHYKIAENIRRIHGHSFPVQSDDVIISMQFGLINKQ